MRKKILIVLSLVIVSMFIVGCGTGQAVKVGKSAQKVPTTAYCGTEKQLIDKLEGEKEILNGELNDCVNKLGMMKNKFYEVKAGMIGGEKGGSFNVNGETISLKEDSTEVLSDSSTLTLLGTMWQSYVGGVKYINFHFAGGCPTNYNIETDFLADGVGFTVNQHKFLLKKGQTEVLPLAAGGGNITLKDSFFQNYAGGLNQVEFDLHC